MPDDALMPDNVKVDQFDQAIDAILAGAPPAADPELAALVQIAASLRDLPDEGFQKRLKSDLRRRATMSASGVAPVREGFRAITPYIAVPNAPELIDFLKRAFGAEELIAQATPGGGFHAEVRIGNSILMIGGGEAARGHERIGAFHVFVPDCDATYRRAIEAGGASMGEPADRPYGERSGFVKDFAGNYWYIATRFPSNAAPEGVGSVLPYAHPAKALPFIDFLKRAFGAQEMGVYQHEGRVMHAAVRIGDAVLEMGESPDFLPSGFYMYVEDCDTVYRSAIEAGATSLWPPTDQPYGDRTSGPADPFGFQWFPATHIQDVTAKPAVIRAVTPFIVVPNAPELIDFLKGTFGAKEISRHSHGSDGFVAAVKIGDSDLFVMGGESVRGQERPAALHVYVQDCDAAYQRAVAAGAVSTLPPAERPWGERAAFVTDPFGNLWNIATRLGPSDVPEGGRRSTSPPASFPRTRRRS